MAVPNINIKLIPVNQFVIKNNDVVSVTMTIVQKMNDAGTGFLAYPAPTPINSIVILPGAEFAFSVTDDLYAFTFVDTTQPITYTYYAIADQNIKECGRKLIITNLCGTGTGCNTQADYAYLRDRLKFFDLSQGLYFIYAQFIGKQSLTMVQNASLLPKKEYLTRLLDMCNCSSDECKSCGNTINPYPTSNTWTWNSTISNCGCSSQM